jgi:hypothetical protein
MIAAVERAATKTKPDRLCVVRWTGRVRLHVEVLTVCGESIDAADGVVQVPEFILTGRAVPSISNLGGEGIKALKICEDCKRAIG